MSVSTVSNNQTMTLLSTMRKSLEDMQRQLSTGQRAETYGTLGAGRTQSITFRSKISEIDSYLSSSDLLQTRIKLLDTAMSRLDDIPTDARSSIDPNTYDIDSSGTTSGQKAAGIALNEVVSLLNSEADGRYLMSGKTTDTKPVVDTNEMLYGTGSKAGLKQVVAERLTADLGTGGLGRLDLSTSTNTVTVARQETTTTPPTTPSSEFGYKISGISSSSTGITVANTTGGGSITSSTLSFSGAKAGDIVTVDLTNPDGTTSTIKLTATESSPPDAGYFTIGATDDDTATNFNTALTSSLTNEVKTDFQAGSMMRAADTYFNTAGGGTAARVDTSASGGDLATATGLRYDTTDDTVQWYVGYNAAIDANDASTLPRNDLTARADTSLTVGYGVRANESAYAKMVQSLAVMTIAQFDPAAGTPADTTATTDAERTQHLENEKARYSALASRVDTQLAYGNGQQDPSDIHTEVAISGNVVNSAVTRQTANKSTLQDLLDNVEGINKEELTAQILTLQTRMEASYQTTMILNNLTLLNYMN